MHRAAPADLPCTDTRPRSPRSNRSPREQCLAHQSSRPSHPASSRSTARCARSRRGRAQGRSSDRLESRRQKLNRARFYQPSIGRFTQEDPAGFAVSLRLYRYAASDPISRTDPGGLWSKKGHDQFISWALSGRVPDFYVTAIQEASARFDGRWGGQMPWNSFMHGMKAPWQSPAEALALRDRFIHEHLGLARCAIQTGDFAGALDHFGIAMHPLMDSFSPAHVGRGDPLSWPLNIPDHSPTEGLGIEAASDITFSMKQKVTWEIWDAYQRVFLR